MYFKIATTERSEIHLSEEQHSTPYRHGGFTVRVTAGQCVPYAGNWREEESSGEWVKWGLMTVNSRSSGGEEGWGTEGFDYWKWRWRRRRRVGEGGGYGNGELGALAYSYSHGCYGIGKIEMMPFQEWEKRTEIISGLIGGVQRWCGTRRQVGRATSAHPLRHAHGPAHGPSATLIPIAWPPLISLFVIQTFTIFFKFMKLL